MCLQNLYFYLLLPLPAWHRFSCSCNISNISLVKKDKRSTTSVIFCLICCNLRIAYFVWPDWHRPLFIVWMKLLSLSAQADESTVACGHAMRKVCWGLYHWCRTKPPIHLPLLLPVTREQNPKILKLPHLWQEPISQTERAIHQGNKSLS